MPSYVPVSRETHASKAWLKYSSYRFAADRALIPLVAAELAKAALAMPLAFVEENGALHLVAVMSLEPGKNQFVAPDGRWLSSYIPAALRGYPFALLRQDGTQESILCVNQDSGLVVDAGTPDAEPFFDDQGSPAPTVKAVLDFLAESETNRAVTHRAITALATAGVLAPWTFQLNTAPGPTTIVGLQRIDEARLNAIANEIFMDLRTVGALVVAYAQILSMGQLGIFKDLNKIKAQISEAQASSATVLAGPFQAASGETLQFDLSQL